MIATVLILGAAVLGTDSVLTEIGRAEADDGQVHAEIVARARPRASVYDFVGINLTIVPTDEAELADLSISRAISGDFYLVRGVAQKTVLPDGRTTYLATLEPLAGGSLTIGPIEIVYTTTGLEGEEQYTLELEAMQVMIAGSIDVQAGDAPAGLKERLDAPRGAPWGWIIAGSSAVVLGVIAVAVVVMHRRKAALPLPPRPAHELALAQLDALVREGLIERGQVEAFLARCSDILRQYIGARFDIDAPDRTTEEFLQEAARSKQLSIGDVVLLEGFLTRIDLVKFAKRDASASEARDAAAQARSFIDETQTPDDAMAVGSMV